jgi:hypothetical protein
MRVVGNNSQSFPTHFPFKISRSHFETHKRPALELVTNGLFWVFLLRPEGDPEETYSRPKRDLFATSVAVVASGS